MKRNLKALGLALLAAFAMSAVAASAAQAENGQNAIFKADEYPAVGTGTEVGNREENYFETTPGRKFHCTNATYEATLSEASTELTVTPHYTGCKSTVGGVEVGTSVDLNGCHYLFTAGTTVTHNGENGGEGSVHVVCPPGTGPNITVTIATCTVHVPPQTLGGKTPGEVTFTNNTATGDILVHIDITNTITATETDGFLCPFEGETHVSTGTYFSTVTFQGFKDEGTHHAVTVDPDGGEHTITTATEGAATPIWVD